MPKESCQYIHRSILVDFLNLNEWGDSVTIVSVVQYCIF